MSRSGARFGRWAWGWWLISSMLAGCVGDPIRPPSDAAAFTMRIEDRDSTSGRFMIYDLVGDGRLHLGAGAAAQEGLTDVIVPLAEDDLAEIRAAIRAAGWPPASASSGGQGPRRLEVRLRLDGTTHRFEILADDRTFDPEVVAVLAPLESISRRRFGTVLDALPRGR